MAIATDLLVKLREALAEALILEWERAFTFVLRQLVTKAAGDSYQPDPDEIADAVNAYDWTDLGTQLQQDAIIQPLASSYTDGAHQVQVSIGLVWNLKNQRAIEYARRRAAELVGMRYVPGRGDSYSLLPNPQAKWRITDTLRDGMRDLITNALETSGVSYQDLKQDLEQQPGWNNLFGEYRAEMIARTELAIASNQGTVGAFDNAGVAQVRVLDNPECPICGPFADTIQTLAWARDNPIGHPNCIRAFNAVLPE